VGNAQPSAEDTKRIRKCPIGYPKQLVIMILIGTDFPLVYLLGARCYFSRKGISYCRLPDDPGATRSGHETRKTETQRGCKGVPACVPA
jgi:hypothetical protein